MTSAESTAHRARESTWLEALTRGGFVGYGITHLAIAWLAIQIAVYHRSGESADQAGAFKLLKHQPLGEVLLVVIVIGLAAMTVWQILQAAVGHTGEDGKDRTKARLASVALAIAYGTLGGISLKVLLGKEGSNSSSQEKATAGVLAHPWGQWLIAIVGLGVLAGGIGMIVYGVRTMFDKKLNLGSASAPTRRAVMWMGRAGYTGKGLTFGIIGVLLVFAALGDKAHRARGLDGALHTLAGQPFGKILLIVVALGLIAFGIYGFAQARYRKI